ncbi:G-type lectin S-receptor-like serine/threonine-protein kinase SD2-5 [Actinidia eriantha]|uniref:G-type lectin S-receptor-like serine/threonine-protein kinase SD2-5 n=1 Tax=Actinidia eriantha TaxID=165200 RepID=UPI0025844498|nr:G-type lectin S-receptor-like serine/threonine-protein kinase SD2-5 [Actinidia eriantha]
MDACFILLFILPFLFFSCSSSSAATIPPIIYLNNSRDPSSWRNDNLIDMNVNSTDGSRVRALLSRNKSLGLGFVCGFYCTGDCISYLFSVIVVGGGNPSVVWSANTDRPVKENASLILTQDGNLVLQDSDGSNVWSTTTAGISVLGINITEFGNLVLFNESESVVWQSFDHPTDTLLAGQRLYEGQKLISSSSATIPNRGLYYATLTMGSGLAAFTQVDKGDPQMYYQLVPEPSSIDQSSRKGHCRLLTRNEVNGSSSSGSDYTDLLTGGFLVNLGTSQEPFGSNRSNLPLDSAIEYIRLNSDGHLKLYRHQSETEAREIVDMVTSDLGVCQHPRLCGDFGFCQEGKCGCPKGVKGFQYSNGGCSRTTPFPLSCQSALDKQQLVEIKNVSYFNVIDSNAAIPNIKDVEGCKQACRQNCSCSAAFFRYDNNVSDGYCYMPSEVLSIREGEIPNYNFTSMSYIKVEMPSEAPDGGRPSTSRKRTRLIAIIAGSGSAVLVIFFVLIVIYRTKFHKLSTEEGEDYIHQVPGMPKRFSNEELRVATKDFKERIGGGGFGSVFKGVLPDGTEVAVKRLYKMGHAVREFLAEVETIGSIHHFNLVRLIGFSAEKSCLLVFEYMSNGSLDNWIFYRDQKPCIDWQNRKKIILDIAKGLAYLHEECRQRIIHLDIKPQNILLDENFNAKISDFGLSKLVDRNDSQVLITLRGTPGYIAPECGQSKITVKVDVYSFGIVLLEIVTGRRNLDGTRSESSKHLLSLLQNKAKEDQLLDIMEDLDDEMHYHREEALRMIRIAAWCLQNDHTRRPLMSTVVKVLEGVMEVDPSINYEFIHAMGSSSVSDGHVSTAQRVSTAQQASVLSNPR